MTPSIPLAAAAGEIPATQTYIPVVTQQPPLVIQYLEHAYESISLSVEWLDRKFIKLTQTVFQDIQLAAIVRVAIKCFVAMAAYYCAPTTCLLLMGAQTIFGGKSPSPSLAMIGMNLNSMVSGITLSSPIVRWISANRFSPTSILLNGLQTIVNVISLKNTLPAFVQHEVSAAQKISIELQAQ